MEIASKIPYSRVRLVESYFFALGMFFEPQHSLGRINLAKTTVLITIFDDTYDAYGTIDELEVLTDTIERYASLNTRYLGETFEEGHLYTRQMVRYIICL